MRSPNLMVEVFIRLWVNADTDPFDPHQLGMEHTVIGEQAIVVDMTYEREILLWHGRN